MSRRLSRPKYDNIPPNLLLRVELSNRNINLYKPDDQSEDHAERSLIMVHTGRGITLTDLTELELDALEAFYKEAIDAARPVVVRQDARAAAAAAAGDMRNIRLWRPKPRLIDYRDINDPPKEEPNELRTDRTTGEFIPLEPSSSPGCEPRGVELPCERDDDPSIPEASP